MKILLLITTSILLFTACTDTKKQEKDALNQVIKIHDEAMANDEKAVKNKMLLDSLVKSGASSIGAKAQVAISNLSATDKAMEDWMHQFEADNANKSHAEIMQYLAEQKKKVSDVNKRLKAAVNESDQLISTTSKK
jgi:hypothetical protein